MPKEYLEPSKTRRDGLAFLGLSLSRKSDVGHPDSVTHQTAFDLNEVQDREYEFLLSCNDDGWLVGGGEPGPPNSYKLKAKDSSHVEIIQFGTYNPEWGGVALETILEAMNSGKILIPQIEVLPTAVVANPDTPPELEIRFDMEPKVPNFDDPTAPLPINWALRFIQNQLFHHFEYPARFCPGPFHSTILRKAEFRSPENKEKYFEKCKETISKWQKEGPKPLNTGWDIDGSELENAPEHCSGIWLFTDRNNISHLFKPNFLPPYDTPEKRKIILDILKEEWDQNTLQWKPIGI
mmetsp:Transcript_22033/g.32549  ORF Transcript_22033/g.32549 Transcript_22033/m.32549 type:complete len:294 (+) Transcript_22033:75-956(+)